MARKAEQPRVTGEQVATAWLDGGAEAHGWFGTHVCDEVVGDRVEDLEVLDRAWRAAPDRVWIGWLTYEFGRERDGTPRLPGMCMRQYRDAVRLNPGETPPGPGWWANAEEPSWWPLKALGAEMTAETFRARVAEAKASIAAGETYQVNLSQEFRGAFNGTLPPREERDARWLETMAHRLFMALRARAPASMGALVEAGDAWIVSNSPERLLSVTLGTEGGPDIARSSPIKGTRRRRRTVTEDADAIAELCASPKERAEHVMIVDLVRSDLGRCAVAGSVRASSTPRVVSLPTVHHMVTDVECELREGWSLRTLIEAVFPGGSVTGAPKRRTMEIIDTLEHGRREIYCGALVVLHPGGVDMSIPIRTGLLDEDGLWLRSGGGIVADSDPEGERLETITKTLAFDPRSSAAPNPTENDV